MSNLSETSNVDQKTIKLIDYLVSVYESKFGSPSADVEISLYFLKSVKDLIDEVKENELSEIITNDRFNSLIARKKEYNRFYQLPIVFLIYYFLKFKKHAFMKIWPYTPDALEPFLVDCGISQRD